MKVRNTLLFQGNIQMINSESGIPIVRTRYCSKCGSEHVHRTHRHSKRDKLFSKMNFYPYYCQECDARSHRFGRQ